MTSLRSLKALAVATAMAGLATAAHAGPITVDYDDMATLAGSSSGTVKGLTFEADGGNIGTKCTSGVCGIGVTGGPSGNEIDIGETLTVTFASATVHQIDVGLLYVGPAWNDPQYLLPGFDDVVYGGEVAKIAATTVDGGIIYGTLTAAFNATTGESFGIWNLGTGSVAYCDGQADVNTTASGGCFNLFNPFGNAKITQLVFTGVKLRGDDAITMLTGGGNDSDYVVSLIRVPEPGIMALLGAGLLGMAMVRRRRVA